VQPRQAEDAEVGVYFPQARGGERKEHRAKIAACFPQHDDDVVLLQLTDGPSLFSAFRTPVEEAAFDKVFRVKPKKPDFLEKPGFSGPIAALNDAAFDAMVKRLVAYRILRHDPQAGTYTAHPLIRNHYLAPPDRRRPQGGSRRA